MMRGRQYIIGVVALLLIWTLMPGRSRRIISTAPELAGTFNPLGGMQAAAALAASTAGLEVMGEPTITVA